MMTLSPPPPTPRKLAFGLGRGKKEGKKVVILGILHEFLTSFLKLVPISKSCVSFLVT